MMKALYFTVAVLSGMAVAVAAEPKSGNFSLSGMGKAGWSLQCALTKPNGATSTAVVRGKSNDRLVIVRSGISSASCKAQASPRAQLTLTMEGGFTCPQAKEDHDDCKWTIEGGQSSEFTVTFAK